MHDVDTNCLIETLPVSIALVLSGVYSKGLKGDPDRKDRVELARPLGPIQVLFVSLKIWGLLPFIDTHHKILTTFPLIPGWFFFVRLFLNFALSGIRSGVPLRRSLLL